MKKRGITPRAQRIRRLISGAVGPLIIFAIAGVAFETLWLLAKWLEAKP
ncbi:MAG TPA: hypothetical protein PKE16_08035 [Hyphomicrobium sp.]|nr:hypothetical protein [Hyphomicrobium sp.]